MSFGRARLLAYVLIALITFSTPGLGWSQQTIPVTGLPVTGGQGFLWFSQFANPSLLGSLYGTPIFPWTGIYPMFPGSLLPILPEEGLRTGPLRLHPFMGVAEMYTDNVFRTNAKHGDFFTTLAPGIQAQLPFAGHHVFVADYRTNIQFYHRTPSNNVQDQTASGRFQFNLARSMTLDLQGEHKLGHDPRGTALDLQAFEPNKWTTNSFTGRTAYEGGQVGGVLTVQTLKWTYLNNNQGIIRDRLSNYAGLTLSGKAFPNTSGILDFNVRQEIYDENKNLDNALYTISTGARWDVSGITSGEFLVGYQFLNFTRAQVTQSGPLLSLFRRDRDSAENLFFMGKLSWNPIPRLTVNLQPYRAIQQTVVFGTSFFTATGVNLSVVRNVTERIDLTANVGYENDRFSTPAGAVGITPPRTDNLKNVAVGLNYRAVKWIGMSLQYIFEDRSSNVDQFNYQANTAMVSVQAFF